MAKKKSTTKAKGTAKPRAAKRTSRAAPRQTQGKQGRTQPQADMKRRTEDNQRAPGEPYKAEPYEDEHQRGEHFRGERNRGRQADVPGSLEQETLDPRAPYNKTYGE